MDVSFEALAVVFAGWILIGLYVTFQSSRDNSYDERKQAKRRGSAGTLHIDPRTFKPFPLLEKKVVSHNTRIFRFQLPAGASLGLETGKHLQLRATINEKPEYRSYTPISDNDDVGYWDLMIKVYDNGKFSKHLDGLSPGDTVDVRGPKGEFEFEMGRWSSITMLAGGTGITPMLQVIKHVLKHDKTGTKLNLIFANVTEGDILLRDELDAWAAKYPDRFALSYTLDDPPEGWSGYSGFITEKMIQDAGAAGPGDNTMVLICGPGMMCKCMERNLEKLGYPTEKYFIF